MVAPNHAQTIQICFPGISAHAKTPAVPFPYTQELEFDNPNDDIERIHKQLIKICVWCRENLEDENLWYINTNGFMDNFFLAKMIFTFDFAHAEDHMAFKLKWG